MALTAPREILYTPSIGDESCLDASAVIVDGAREGLVQLWISEFVDLFGLEIQGTRSCDPRALAKLQCGCLATKTRALMCGEPDLLDVCPKNNA